VLKGEKNIIEELLYFFMEIEFTKYLPKKNYFIKKHPVKK